MGIITVCRRLSSVLMHLFLHRRLGYRNVRRRHRLGMGDRRTFIRLGLLLLLGFSRRCHLDLGDRLVVNNYLLDSCHHLDSRLRVNSSSSSSKDHLGMLDGDGNVVYTDHLPGLLHLRDPIPDS